MLGDVSPQTTRLTAQAVVYPGRDHVVSVTIEKTDGRRYTQADLSAVTRAVLVFPKTSPTIAYDSLTDAVFTFGANGVLAIDLSDYAMPASIYASYLILFDAEHPGGQVLVDNVDNVLTFDFRNISTTGDTPPPTVEYISEAPMDSGLYGRQDGGWVSIADVVAGVASVNGQTGIVMLDAADVGADPAGEGAAQVALHVAAVDPHPQYTTAAEAASAAPVQSVNSATGVVVLTASSVGADPAGTGASAAAAAVSAHEAALDPHPQYQTQAESDTRYERGLTAGANISIDRTDPSAPVISATGGAAGEVNTASNLGAGVGLFAQKNGVDLEFKGLVAGTNVTLTPSATGVTIDAAGGGGGAVDSVNGQTGAVVLGAADVGADAAGTAVAAVAAHEAAGDPHPQYLTSAEGNAAYAPLSHVGSTGATHGSAVAAGAAGFMTGADKSKLDGVAAGANNYSHPNHTGDVTSVGDGAQTIANNAVTNAKAADMAVNTIKGRITAGTGDPEDLTAANVRTIINVADGATANSSDATLLARANHTGTQAISTVSGLQTALDGKQATLVSGTNIKTINGVTVLGSGDIVVSGGVSLPAVQTFTGGKTLALADINTYNVSQDATAQTVTIPPQSSVVWTANAEIHIEQGGTGLVTVTGGTGVAVNGVSAGSFALAGQRAVVTLKRTGADSWTLVGALDATGTSPTFTALTLTNGQIVFPATQVPSANANTLDDYEEGTWTPTLTFATPGNLSVTYSEQVGKYTKIGRVVTFDMRVTTSAFTHTTASGMLFVAGLPFTVSASSARSAGPLAMQGWTSAGRTAVVQRAVPSTNTMDVLAYGSAAGVATLTTAEVATGGTVILIGSAVYST